MSKANSKTKICPSCKQEITARAIKCRHCGEVVEVCNYHKTEATARCSKCGMFLCGDCTRTFEIHKFCPYCYSQVKTGLEKEDDAPANPKQIKEIIHRQDSAVPKAMPPTIKKTSFKIVEENAPVYCRMCGKNLNEQANQEICLGCGVKAGVGNNFCPNCGTATNPLAVMCVKCGAMFEDFRYPKFLQKYAIAPKIHGSWFAMHLDWATFFIAVLYLPVGILEGELIAGLVSGIGEPIFFGVFLGSTTLCVLLLGALAWILRKKNRSLWWLLLNPFLLVKLENRSA